MKIYTILRSFDRKNVLREWRKHIFWHYVVVNCRCLRLDVGMFSKALFSLREESEGDGAEQYAGDETPQPPVATNQ